MFESSRNSNLRLNKDVHLREEAYKRGWVAGFYLLSGAGARVVGKADQCLFYEGYRDGLDARMRRMGLPGLAEHGLSVLRLH